jgi:hypothetical protein
MSIYEFIEKLNDGKVKITVSKDKEVSIGIAFEGLVYENEFPLGWSDEDCTTIALGKYMTELVG